MRVEKDLVSVRICTNFPEHLLLDIAISTVNPEIFAIILFSRIALKYIFATLRNRD